MTTKTDSTEHILFLTGKLAKKRLHRVLDSMQPVEFTYEVRNLGVSVAALMTAKMIGRRLKDARSFTKIIVPGLCRGNLSQLGDALGSEIIRGPVDLKDLPVFFGRDLKAVDLSQQDVLIFGEIVDAPMVDIGTIVRRAHKYRADGADIIDIRTLKQEGFQVSIDSLEGDNLLRGGKAGADYLLSLKESTLWIAAEVDSTPILIPDKHKDLSSLYRSIETLSAKNRPFFADAILDPIHFGFTNSICRYRELRQQCPDIDIIMGVGNLTELTEADTTGINAMLFGIISELELNAVLATEVSAHCASAIREADRARRIMYAARQENSLPKGLDSGLLGMHSREPFPYTTEEIAEIANEVKDPSYRVQNSREGIHVYNRDGIVLGRNPFDLFPQLDLLQDDAPHAFYMGVELGKAQIALQLGKELQAG